MHWDSWHGHAHINDTCSLRMSSVSPLSRSRSTAQSHSHGFHEEHRHSSEHGQGAFWKKYLLTTKPVRTWPATNLLFLRWNRWVASRGKRAWNPCPGNQLVSSQGQYICRLVPLQPHSVCLSLPSPLLRVNKLHWGVTVIGKATRTELDSTPDKSWFSTGDWQQGRRAGASESKLLSGNIRDAGPLVPWTCYDFYWRQAGWGTKGHQIRRNSMTAIHKGWLISKLK